MMNSVPIALLSGLSLVVFTALRAGDDRRPPTASKSRAGQATFASVCGNCHGANGEGRTDLKTPSIAALPYWYVETQLGKFRQSVRGGRPDDTGGRLMHAVAQTLSEAQAKAVAGFVSELTRRPTRNTLRGDVERGEFLFRDVCMACHRYNASGEKVFGSPPLTGLQDWYIASQLRKFRKGIRGGHKEDARGAKMHLMVNELTDRDLDGLATYVSVLAEKYPAGKK